MSDHDVVVNKAVWRAKSLVSTVIISTLKSCRDLLCADTAPADTSWLVWSALQGKKVAFDMRTEANGCSFECLYFVRAWETSHVADHKREISYVADHKREISLVADHKREISRVADHKQSHGSLCSFSSADHSTSTHQRSRDAWLHVDSRKPAPPECIRIDRQQKRTQASWVSSCSH